MQTGTQLASERVLTVCLRLDVAYACSCLLLAHATCMPYLGLTHQAPRHALN